MTENCEQLILKDRGSSARVDLPILRDIARKFSSLADEIMHGSVICRDDVPFDLMVLVFFSKQSEHLESLLALTRSTPSRDTALIARSMMEGLAQLLWAYGQPEERAERWRAYAFVADWRLLCRKDKAGESTDPHERDFIEQGLQRYGDLFLTVKARNAKQADQPLPSNPYHDTWTGKTIAELIQETIGQRLYDVPCKYFVDWHHWNHHGVLLPLSSSDDQLTYVRHCFRTAAASLALGIWIIEETLKIADDQLRLGISHRLDCLHREYTQRLQATSSAKQARRT